MIPFQRISLVFKNSIADIDVDQMGKDLYHTYLFCSGAAHGPWVSNSPDSSIGDAAQTAIMIEGRQPREIWLDPGQEFISTGQAISKLAFYRIKTISVIYV